MTELEELTDLERFVFTHYYGIAGERRHTLAELAVIYEISQRTSRALLLSAWEKLPPVLLIDQ